MKRYILILLAALVSIGTESVAKAPSPVTVYYEAKLSSDAFGDMGVRKMWIKGENMRYNLKSRMSLTVIKNSNGVFLIHPWQKIAAKYPKQWDRGNPSKIMPGPFGPVDQFVRSVKAKKQGRVTVNKQLCDYYTYTDPLTKRPCKLWVQAKSQKPVKLTLVGQKKKSDTITATYTKFDLGAKISDSLFDLPKGYKIRPMPALDKMKSAKVKSEDRKSG